MAKYFTAFVFIISIQQQLLAQDTLHSDTANRLDEVTVTYKANKTTPVTFQNISSKELKTKSTGQEPSFLLSETPSVTAYSDAGNTQGYSYFRMRGIDQTRINISLDGVPLNEPEDQGAYFSNYPDLFNSISKIQIQRGVGTSKNGVASYGGSLQLFSPDLYDSSKATIGFGYGSFNSIRAFGEYNSGVKNGKAIYARASKIYSDGYKYHSSNNSQSVFISTGLFHTKTTWKLNILAGHQQNELAWLGVPDSLIATDRKTNANKNERDNFRQCLIHLQNNWKINSSSALQSGVYYTYLRGNYDFNLNGFLGLPTTAELYNYAFQSNLTGLFSNYSYSGKRLNWTTGIHGNLYNRQHLGSDNMLGELYKNKGYKNEISLFTKAEYIFKPFTFFGDVQYRYASFDYRGTVAFNTNDWTFINPKAGISLSINPRSVFYYSIGRTGREPTRNDMFGGNDDLLSDSDGNAVLFVTAPEHVLDHELGFRHQSQRVNVNLNAYYLSFTNEIVLDGKFGPNGLALTDKVDRSFRTGVEMTASYQLNQHFMLTNNSSFNHSRIKEQKETFTPVLTPPVIINQEIIYSGKQISLALSMRYQDRSYIDFANTATIKSYVLLNGRIEYDAKRFQLTLFINNMTNTKYFNNGYVDTDGSRKYFVQSPLNAYASLKYSF